MGLQKGLGFIAITNFWYGKLPFQAIFLRPDLITTEVRRQMQFRMTIQKEMENFKREQVVPSLAARFPTQHACTCIRCCKDSVCWTKPPPTFSIFQQTVHSVKYKSKQKKRWKWNAPYARGCCCLPFEIRLSLNHRARDTSRHFGWKRLSIIQLHNHLHPICYTPICIRSRTQLLSNKPLSIRYRHIQSRKGARPQSSIPEPFCSAPKYRDVVAGSRVNNPIYESIQ